MSLTASAINQWNAETQPKTILVEWLGKWFDGNSHTLTTDSGGTTSIIFPKVNIECDVSIAQQPVQASSVVAEIRILIEPGKSNTYTGDGGLIKYSGMLISFWINSSIKEVGAGNANYYANKISDLLCGLLNHPTYKTDLNEKGLFNIRNNKAKTYASDAYKTRLVKCYAETNYTIK